MNTNGSKKTGLQRAAILSADICGYSRLMGIDEQRTVEQVWRRFDFCRETIREERGKYFHVVGDNLMAVFDNAQAAVRTAVRIQRHIQRGNQADTEGIPVELRIGVNAGNIRKYRDRVYGQTVNITARLEQTAPPTGICVSKAVFEDIELDEDIPHEYLGPQSFKNIAEKVEVYRLWPVAEKRLSGMLQASDVVPMNDDGINRPSIAVLPLQNLSSDPYDAYLAVGLTEDLIGELTRFRGLLVVAKSSAIAFKDTTLSLSAIGQALHCDYVLTGTVRRLNGDIRINVQLMRCNEEKQIWADRYTIPSNKLMLLCDKVIGDIVGVLENRVAGEELRLTQRRPIESYQAYDYWLQANHLMEQWTDQGDSQSVLLLEKAIALDPNFARAYAYLAAVYNSRSIVRPGYRGHVEDCERALQLAVKAVSLDNSDARNHVNLGFGYLLRWDFVRGGRHFELAGELNPNDSSITIARAIACAYLGEANRGLRLAHRAIEQNRLHPEFYLGNLATIQFLVGDYQATIETTRLVPDAWPEIWAWHTAAAAMSGDLKLAERSASTFYGIVGELWDAPDPPTAQDIVDWLLRINPMARQQDRERFVGALRLAGFIDEYTFPDPPSPAP